MSSRDTEKFACIPCKITGECYNVPKIGLGEVLCNWVFQIFIMIQIPSYR